MKVLISKCCGADLELGSDETHVWVECSKCGEKYNMLTNKELLAKVDKFIKEPDEDE